MKDKGIITTYVLVFGAIFLLIISGLLTFILLQMKQSEQKVAWNQSLEIAEAGLDYYKWCLNNEIEDNCQTEINIEDLSGNIIGTASLEIISETYCGVVSSREIVSIGKTEKMPNVDRKIKLLYGKESVGTFAYLLNDNVWAGADREIKGFYHSNGGIRMDGENQSIVSSASPNGEWVCTDSFGCDSCPISDGCVYESRQCKCPGCWTPCESHQSILGNIFKSLASSFI